jgi:sugar phosphate permease
VVGCGLVIQLLSGGLLYHAFGAYFVHLQTEFRWSRTVVAGSYSLMQVESGLVGPLQGWLIDRFGTRTIAQIGLVFFAVGFGLFSLVHSTLAFYAAFVVIAVGSSLAGWVTLSVAVSYWFYRRRATALGLVSAGHAMGGLLVPLVAWFLTTFGWRATATGSGLLILLVGLPVTLLMRGRPQEYGLLPDGGAPGSAYRGGARGGEAGQPTATPPVGREFTAREALRSPAFWFIGLGHAFAVVVVSAVSVHLIPHLVTRLEISVELASTLLAFMTLVTLVGHVCGGIVADRMEKRYLAALAMVGHALGVLVLAFASSLGWVLLFAVLHGLAWGVRGPLMSAIRADYFGGRAFGTIMGYSSLVIMLGTVMGPLLAGFFADRFGTYKPGFVLIAALGGIGTIFFLLARRPALPPQAKAEARPSAGA